MPYSDKPLYDSLPPNWDADGSLRALLAPSDSKLKAVADLLESWYTYVNPALCPDKALDWLASFYAIPFWANRWSSLQKRSLLLALKAIRRLRGTMTSFTMAMDALGYQYKVVRTGASYLSLKLSSPLYSGEYKAFIKLPRQYPYGGPVFQDAQAASDALLPVGTDVTICHEHFYLGLTPLSHPLFKS